MRAIGVHEHGGPRALQLVELPEPAPAPDQVVVRVHAATVNPTDTFMRNGMYRQLWPDEPLPDVPGMDAAGVLEAVGPEADTDLAVGDRVMAVVLPRGSHGAYAERVALPAGSVAAAPAGTSHAEASTLPMNGLTARQVLDLLALSPGDTLAVTGAAGVLGGYGIQLAKARGLFVIADAAPKDEGLVADLGADVVVPRGDDVAERIRGHAPDGVDGLLDGSVQNELLFPAVADGGGFATVRGFKADPPRGIVLHQVWVHRDAEDRGRLEELRRQAEQGVLTLRVADTFPPEEAAEAHRRLEAGGVRGRLVIEL